jgi:hypothetical protein
MVRMREREVGGCCDGRDDLERLVGRLEESSTKQQRIL